MATSRFAHFLKVMARDKIGSFMEASDCEIWLNRWIQNYVNPMEAQARKLAQNTRCARQRSRSRKFPGAPGSYNAVAYLRPWLQMEELTTSHAHGGAHSAEVLTFESHAPCQRRPTSLFVADVLAGRFFGGAAAATDVAAFVAGGVATQSSPAWFGEDWVRKPFRENTTGQTSFAPRSTGISRPSTP